MTTKERALQKVESLSRKIVTGETSLEAWKWQRAEAMAEAADAKATKAEIAKAAGISRDEAAKHIAVGAKYHRILPANRPLWSKAYDDATGFDRDAAQARTDHARTKRTLTDAPLEQVEQIVAALPKERQQALAAAAGNAYHQARQDYAENEARLTPDEKREREHAQEAITRPLRQATAAFTALGIATHLEQATDQLRELVADSSLTPREIRQIDMALTAFTTEFEFAQTMVIGTEMS